MQGLFSSLMGNMKARYQSCLRNAALQVAIGFSALIALGFFTASGFIYLLDFFNAAETALIVGGIYLIVVMLLVSFLAISNEQSQKKVKPSSALGQDAFLTRLVDDISTKGFQPSQLALLASLPVLKNVNPKHIALLVMIAGFVSGRKIKS